MRRTLIALGLAVTALFAVGLRQGDYGQLTVNADTSGVAITSAVDVMVINYDGSATIWFCFEAPDSTTSWKRLEPKGTYSYPPPGERDGADLIDTLVVHSADTVDVGYDSWRRP
jgi:hypothetical protein